MRTYKAIRPGLWNGDYVSDEQVQKNYVKRDTREALPAGMIRNIALSEMFTCFEGTFNYSSYGLSDEFKEVVGDLIKEFHPKLNKNAATAVRNGSIGQFLTDESRMLDRIDRERLRIALEFCKEMSYDVTAYPIIVSSNMGDNVLGMAEDGKIYISTRTFMQGTKMLVGTLLEEFWHLKHGITDESRGMQNFLIDTIVSLGERVTGRPL